MDEDHHQCLLYRNAPLTLIDSYLAIEKFLSETRLAFFDQWKLFELLKYLLPKEDNHLSCQHFVMWLVKRMEEQQQQQPPERSTPENSFSAIIKNESIEREPNPPMIIQDEISEIEDETSDLPPPLEYSASTSTNYSVRLPTKTIMYKGRNMMKHLRPRTTLTSFARHVASDLFTREEIMAKLHVDHNNERDIFLRHCICTAWNLSEQELYAMWPKIRNALLQLRRDAIAGKCIRMTSKRPPSHQNPIDDDDDDDEGDDDESQTKFDHCR